MSNASLGSGLGRTLYSIQVNIYQIKNLTSTICKSLVYLLIILSFCVFGIGKVHNTNEVGVVAWSEEECLVCSIFSCHYVCLMNF